MLSCTEMCKVWCTPAAAGGQWTQPSDSRTALSCTLSKWFWSMYGRRDRTHHCSFGLQLCAAYHFGFRLGAASRVCMALEVSGCHSVWMALSATSPVSPNPEVQGAGKLLKEGS